MTVATTMATSAIIAPKRGPSPSMKGESWQARRGKGSGREPRRGRGRLTAGRAVVDRLLGGGVDLLGTQQHGRLDARPAGRVDGERDRRRRLVVGEVCDHEGVVVAEPEVEAL